MGAPVDMHMIPVVVVRRKLVWTQHETEEVVLRSGSPEILNIDELVLCSDNLRSRTLICYALFSEGLSMYQAQQRGSLDISAPDKTLLASQTQLQAVMSEHVLVGLRALLHGLEECREVRGSSLSYF